MLDILKSAVGIAHSELTIPPSDIHMFRYGTEAARWIGDGYHPEVPIVMLPYYTNGTEIQSRDTAIKQLRGKYSHLSAATSEIYWEGNRVPALLVSELADQHGYQGSEGIYYRDSTLDNVPSILRHGIYQLPGRALVRVSPHAYIDGSRVKLAFHIDNNALIGEGDEYAIAFDHRHLVDSVPRAVSSQLPSPQINRQPVIPDSKQILSWGLYTGMLGRIAPSAFDVEETLRVNTQLTEQYQSPVYRKNLEQLKRIVET